MTFSTKCNMKIELPIILGTFTLMFNLHIPYLHTFLKFISQVYFYKNWKYVNLARVICSYLPFVLFKRLQVEELSREYMDIFCCLGHHLHFRIAAVNICTCILAIVWWRILH